MIKAAVKEVAVQVGMRAGIAQLVPPALQAAGLNEGEIAAGLAVLELLPKLYTLRALRLPEIGRKGKSPIPGADAKRPSDSVRDVIAGSERVEARANITGTSTIAPVTGPARPASGLSTGNTMSEGGVIPRTIGQSVLRAEDPRTRSGYDPGAAHIDHSIARVFGGGETRTTPAAMNLRKGGLEEELRKYEDYLIRNGMKRAQARQVIADEIESLSRDVNAAPFSTVFEKGFTLDDIDQ